MRIRLWPIEAYFFRTANIVSLAFCACVYAAIVGSGFEAQRVAEAKAEAEREARLAKLQFEQSEITCLANVAKHEAGNQSKEVRSLVIKTVLAIVGDRTTKLPKTVCALAKVPGFFSQISGVKKPHHDDPRWTTLEGEVSNIYYGDRALPRGWGCVRGFRLSDTKMETLGPKAIAQLGFTMEAKGLKYFAAHRVPIDTRGDITFYSPRGGCKDPSPTI